MVCEIFRRKGITAREMSPEELAEMEPIRNPYGVIDAYAEATRRAAEVEGVPSLIIGLKEAEEDHFIDADHPSAEGNIFLAQKVLEMIPSGTEGTPNVTE